MGKMILMFMNTIYYLHVDYLITFLLILFSNDGIASAAGSALPRRTSTSASIPGSRYRSNKENDYDGTGTGSNRLCLYASLAV